MVDINTFMKILRSFSEIRIFLIVFELTRGAKISIRLFLESVEDNPTIIFQKENVLCK